MGSYSRHMHPIERLRYVARAGSAPDRILVAESIPALAAFSHTPQMLLVALRQLIARQPESPGLLAVGAHMLHSLDPIDAGWSFSQSLDDDRTVDIAETTAIAESGGTDVIDSIASGRGANGSGVEVLCPIGTRDWLADCRNKGRSAAVVTPLGSRLPPLLWGAFSAQEGGPGAMSAERLSLADFDDVIGPQGVAPLSTWSPDCPDVAELARR